MGDTNFDNVVCDTANAVVAGRGDYTAQMALIKADLSAIAAAVAEANVDITALAAEISATKVDVTALVALANDIKAKYNAHTHNADGSESGSYFTSPPRTDAADVTAGTPGTTAVADAAVTVDDVTPTIEDVTITAK